MVLMMFEAADAFRLHVSSHEFTHQPSTAIKPLESHCTTTDTDTQPLTLSQTRTSEATMDRGEKAKLDQQPEEGATRFNTSTGLPV